MCIRDRTWGENYVCNKKRVWKSRSATAAQDAHEAIRPPMPELTPDQVEGSISGDEAKIKAAAQELGVDLTPFELIHCTEDVDMHDDPVKACLLYTSRCV